MFQGLYGSPVNLPLLSKAKSRSISAENYRGEKNAGGLAAEGTGARCARDLGVGWKVSPSVLIDAGATFTLCDIEGPGAVQSLWITGYVGRDFILRMYWDDQQWPSVEAPLSDFFAAGWYDNSEHPLKGPFAQLQSLMVNVNPNKAFSCFWQMPFRKRCRMTLENRAETSKTCYYQINYALAPVPEEAAYFHAQYRQARPLEAGKDHVILDQVRGQGHYVGTALSVGLNGLGRWWGEGEIKFFMDGDENPTICGTGTEDYFLGAYDWDVDGEYTTYNSPYAGMFYVRKPDGMYNAQQRFSMYRWHVADPIRFETDLRVTIQDLGWYKDGRYLPRGDDLCSVAYWYQTLPSVPHPPMPDRDALQVS